MKADVFIPILLHPDIPTAERAAEAVRMGRQLGDSATVLIVEAILPGLEGHWGAELAGVPGMIADLEARQHAAATALAQHLKDQATLETVRISQSQIPHSVSVRARSHDLAILSVETSQSRDLGKTLVFEAGRPIVLVPSQMKPPAVSRIAIAWDGGRAAARAVHDAMPWILQASSITIITAFDDKSIAAQTVADLETYLARHGLTAYAEDVSAADGIGVALQDGALRHGADMLVMGAYGHSRFREFVLGGATVSVFSETQLPIFMSH